MKTKKKLISAGQRSNGGVQYLNTYLELESHPYFTYLTIILQNALRKVFNE